MTGIDEIYAYEQEWHTALERLESEEPHLHHLDYFFNLVRSHFAYERMRKEKPPVVILGTCIPEELVYAAGATPYWVLGGSLRTGLWAGDFVPRDTDPVSRSALGFLGSSFLDFAQNALILIPIVNDSSRKLAYLLRQTGKKVHTIDLPPVKDQWAEEKWLRQMERCGEVLSAYTGHPVSRNGFRQALKKVNACRKQINGFLQVADSRPGILSGSCRMMILNSYYYASDIEEWRLHLKLLTNEIQKRDIGGRRDAGRNVLVLGSPVYFPNYKIPFLIQDAGLNIRYQADDASQRMWQPYLCHSESSVIQSFFKRDCSGAYTQNTALRTMISQLLEQRNIDGVVYHVLKGQIEYDFELEQLEMLFSNYDLPVFRLETDYNPQDVEQLRIRLDAFMEMLTQRSYRREAKAV